VAAAERAEHEATEIAEAEPSDLMETDLGAVYGRKSQVLRDIVTEQLREELGEADPFDNMTKEQREALIEVQMDAYLEKRSKEFESTRQQRLRTMPATIPRERQTSLPLVAIIGRPNVGKSTVFNRLTGRYKGGAIVDDEPGITRDRSYGRGSWNGYNFRVVDTGGLLLDDLEGDPFRSLIRDQCVQAMSEADVILLVTDGQAGLHPQDVALAEYLRKALPRRPTPARSNETKPIPLYVCVNKCESPTKGITQAQEFWSLGFGEPHPVSGIQGTGVGDVLDKVVTHIPWVPDVEVEDDEEVNIAIIGRPNVGKSSLLNRLLGEQRVIVSDVPGTTRDAIDVELERQGRVYRLVDTAGIRRRSRVLAGQDSEFYMVNRAERAIERSDVCLLLIDVVQGIADQDLKLAEKIVEAGKACLVLCNKWDAVDKDDKTYDKAVDYIRTVLYPLRWSAIEFISAKTGQRVARILDMVDEAVEQHRRRIPTSLLNEVLRETVGINPPPVVGGRQAKLYYIHQASTRPPTFIVFCNQLSSGQALLSDSYKRYLDRKFREALGFKGTPIRWIFREKRLRQMVQQGRKRRRAVVRR